MLIFTMAVATAHATTDIKNEKKDTGISIESKEKKVSTYKITWNANGGKIGTKKTKITNVRKGSKIGKLTTPKRSGYGFKGWFTKKSGGKKITTSTKPTKKVTYYAQWQKKSSPRALNAEEKKLVGSWATSSITPGLWSDIGGGYEEFLGSSASVSGYKFNANGTYIHAFVTNNAYFSTKGNWKVSSNGKMLLTNNLQTSNSYINKKVSDNVRFYRFSTESNKYGVRITSFSHGSAADLDRSYFYDFYKKQ